MNPLFFDFLFFTGFMNSKIKILYVFHTSIIGGGSYCLLSIIKNLDKNRYTPIVLLRDKGPLVDELLKAGAIVYFENTLSTVPYNSSLFSLNSIKQIISIIFSFRNIYGWIKRTNAEIVHYNTMMMYPYLLASHASKIKSVIHMRENWPDTEHQLQFSIARKTIKKYADRIIVINNTSANILNIPDKTTVVYDSIDFSNRNKSYDFSKVFGTDFLSNKIFVFLGGINPQKGTLSVVETFSSRFKDENLRLLVVGADVLEPSKKSFKSFILSLLSLFNYHTYTDKVKRIAELDHRIKLVPSTYHVKSIIEQSYCVLSFFTIPHANLMLAESIFLEKPVIAASTLEAIEYSNNGEAALLFEMNNQLEFENKINYILNNYEDFINFKLKTGAVVVQNLFDNKKNSLLLNQVYTNLIN